MKKPAGKVKSTAPCGGCRNNFYNGNNDLGVSRCWSLKDARLVKRWRIGWWTTPTIPGAFVQVKTYDCHHETGRYGFSEDLPLHAVEPVRLLKEASE
ncbi:hypothetical protein LCGC14_2449400 [marine sediment metagenome]|uniref:Uncharacterized protein n=1 Tax=marine sediment metagenome TaxID=412755 RepID=A0A0F9C466_9ZZZZ